MKNNNLRMEPSRIPERRYIAAVRSVAEADLDTFNQRLNVYSIDGDPGVLVPAFTRLSRDYGFSKIIVRARAGQWEAFLDRGYVLEAVIPGFFGGETAYLVADFASEDRSNSGSSTEAEEILCIVLEEPTRPGGMTQSRPSDRVNQTGQAGEAVTEPATLADVEELACLYRTVFPIYPVPLDDPRYLAKQMQEDAIFRVVRTGGRIISAASAMMDRRRGNAELGDCATDPDFRGTGAMQRLLLALEADLREQGIPCSYALARATSRGMNRALCRLGYSYHGRLVNNCYMMTGELVDLNVWHKDLGE